MLTRLLFWISLAALATSATLAWRNARAAREWDESRQTARREVAGLQSQLQRLEMESSRLEVASRPKPVDPAVRRTPPDAAAADAMYRTLESNARTASEARKALLLKDPQLQVLNHARARAKIRDEWGMLYRQLGLTADESDRITTAFLENQLSHQDIEALVRINGLPRNDPSLKTLREKTDAEFMRAIKDVVGEKGAELLRDYSGLSDSRIYVTSFAGLLSRLGDPLTFAQATALTQIMGKAAPPLKMNVPGLQQFTPANWREIEEQARAVLTPEQWRLFTSVTPPGQTNGRKESEVREKLAEVTAVP